MPIVGWKTGWIVGSALVAAGALLVGISTSVETVGDPLVLAVMGSGLVAAGSTVMLRMAPLDMTQARVIGGVLIAAGTITAVLPGLGDLSSITTSLTPVGGALFVAGLVELVLGSTQTSAPVR